MAENIGKDDTIPDPALNCEQWEALLADKMDGTLLPEAEAAFAEHGRKCPGCAGLLEQAQKGQEWLKLLEQHTPAAPVDLLSRILAKTQGAGREGDYALGSSPLAGSAGSAVLPGHGGRWGIPFLPPAGMVAARGAHNARMLMTGAMAFFSVALTLSVAGVRLTSVHAAELRPQAMQANVSRSFYGTKKQVVSFYENLRLVYEVESKMHDIRHDTQQLEPAKPVSGGSSAPKAHAPAGGHAAAGEAPAAKDSGKHPAEAEQVVHGWPLAVDYQQRLASAPLKRGTSAVISVGTGTYLNNVLLITFSSSWGAAARRARERNRT